MHQRTSSTLRVEYRNLLSRLILRHRVDEQFPFPLRPLNGFLEKFLQWYERRLLNIDLGNISIDRPIILVGLPRSGTTILQDVLCAHPGVAYVTNAMNQFPTCFCAVEDLRRRSHVDFKVERFLGDSLEIRPGSANEGLAILSRWARFDLYSLEYREIALDDFSPEQIEEGLRIIKKIIWCFGPGPYRLLNKNPGLLPHLPVLREVFPDCRVIHIIRDPRMCANSMVKLCRQTQAQELAMRSGRRKGGRPPDLFVPYPRLPRLPEYIKRYGVHSVCTTAHLWNDAISMLEASKREMLSFYTVRFEDILANPQQEILKILDFCELPPVEDPDSLFAQTVLKIGAIRHRNVYGDYAAIESICRPNMSKYGYD